MLRMRTKEDWITEQTDRGIAKAPGSSFLAAAVVAIVGSIVLRVIGRRDDSQFVGIWAPTFLALAVYHRVLKVLGRD